MQRHHWPDDPTDATDGQHHTANDSPPGTNYTNDAKRFINTTQVGFILGRNVAVTNNVAYLLVLPLFSFLLRFLALL